MSSSASELTTVTEERTEISVEKEEVTLYECPCCEQTVDEDELVPVALGEEDTETVACEYCARTLFGFDADSDDYDVVDVVGETADSLADRLVLPLVRVTVPLAFMIWVGSRAFASVNSAIEEMGTEQVMLDVATTLPDILLGILPLVFLIISLSALLRTAPRM